MNKRTSIVAVIVAIVILGLIVIAAKKFGTRTPLPGAQGTGTNPGLVFDQTASDGTVTLAIPSASYGLATTPDQVLVHSYIPPCDQNFGYCIYYTGTAYAGTNFESSGIRMLKRADLATERVCLDTPPSGFDASMKSEHINSSDAYSSSVFSNVGQGAAGHIASGKLYRLFVRGTNTCYEFETRIGQSQYANYPAGTIKEFTTNDQAVVAADLETILEHVSLGSMNGLFQKV